MLNELTADTLRSALKYDQETGVFTWINPRKKALRGCQAGRLHKQRGYREIYIGGKLYYAHRLAWLYMSGKFPSKLIDHIDHKKDNNSWCNLREVDHSVNGKHRKQSQSNSKTGVKGVSKSGKGFRARIFEGGKEIRFGTFDTIEEATSAYHLGISKYRTLTGDPV